MKYQLHTRFEKGCILPDWSPGFDRLSFISPYPDVEETMERFILEGKLSRYVEDDDRLEISEDYDDLYTIFETSDGANEWHELNLTKPTVIFSVVSERPDL